jgi:hypothetical protein
LAREISPLPGSEKNFLPERFVMCKFSGKIMMLAATALILSAGTAVAGQSSGDWNDSWGFPGTFEKSRLVEQALAIELVEEDGFNNTSTYVGHNYFGNYVGDGGILAIDNSINDSVLDSFNTTDSYNTTDSFNKTKTTTTTTTTNVNKTNNTTNTTNTNIEKNINFDK